MYAPKLSLYSTKLSFKENLGATVGHIMNVHCYLSIKRCISRNFNCLRLTTMSVVPSRFPTGHRFWVRCLGTTSSLLNCVCTSAIFQTIFGVWTGRDHCHSAFTGGIFVPVQWLLRWGINYSLQGEHTNLILQGRCWTTAIEVNMRTCDWDFSWCFGKAMI